MDQPTLSIRMITVDCHDPSALAAFWAAATGSEVVADHGEFVMLGTDPALGFQRVEDPTPGKNRLHLDGGGEDRQALVERLRDLGATVGETHTVPGLTWTTLTDPEGNAFCVGEQTPLD
ncbi:VOC family protein [Kytococcus sp. Marseille-QA3725]